MTREYRGLQGLPGGYKGLQRVTGGYKRLQGVTGGDKGLQRVTKDYRSRSIQPKFSEISVQNSMDRFGLTGKVSIKLVHLLRWSSFPGRTGLNFG